MQAAVPALKNLTVAVGGTSGGFRPTMTAGRERKGWQWDAASYGAPGSRTVHCHSSGWLQTSTESNPALFCCIHRENKARSSLLTPDVLQGLTAAARLLVPVSPELQLLLHLYSTQGTFQRLQGSGGSTAPSPSWHLSCWDWGHLAAPRGDGLSVPAPKLWGSSTRKHDTVCLGGWDGPSVPSTRLVLIPHSCQAWVCLPHGFPAPQPPPRVPRAHVEQRQEPQTVTHEGCGDGKQLQDGVKTQQKLIFCFLRTSTWLRCCQGGPIPTFGVTTRTPLVPLCSTCSVWRCSVPLGRSQPEMGITLLKHNQLSSKGMDVTAQFEARGYGIGMYKDNLQYNL